MWICKTMCIETPINVNWFKKRNWISIFSIWSTEIWAIEMRFFKISFHAKSVVILGCWFLCFDIPVIASLLVGVRGCLRIGWRDSTVLFIFLYCIVCNFMCEHVNMGRSKSAPDNLTLVAGPTLRRTTGFTSREHGLRDQGFLTSISHS